MKIKSFNTIYSSSPSFQLMMSDKKTLTADFEEIVRHYLVNCSSVRNTQQTRNLTPELEIRFGTNPKQAKPITSVDYQNIVNYLSWNGWTTDDLTGVQMLRIIPNTIAKGGPPDLIMKEKQEKEPDLDNAGIIQENTEQEFKGGAADGRVQLRSSNIRAELFGVDMIQSYCHHNDLVKMKDNYAYQAHLKFTKKSMVTNPKNDSKFQRLKFPDFNFNVSYMEEEEYRMTSNYMPIKKILLDWGTSLKTYRSINRVRFKHPDYPVFVDISIVKTNRKHVNRHTNQRDPIPTGTIQEANVFHTPPVYEVELELDNSYATFYNTREKFPQYMAKIRYCIRVILSALQGTPYPISYDEQETVMNSYMCRLYDDTWLEKKTPRPFFVGPNSVPLQLENVVTNSEGLSSVANIKKEYTITEKADGERCLLYVSKEGRVYLISNSLRVMFTGSVTKNKKCFHSLLDGEFIMYGKENKRLFLFAAFDIYFFGGMEKEANVRKLPFATMDATALEDTYRLTLLQKFHQMLELEPVTPGASCVFIMRVKQFESCDDTKQSIFEAGARVWEKRHHFDYEIDGLIYTPMTFGVGGDRPGEVNEIEGKKFTWKHSFKWKPPHYNTIDFLVSTMKDKDGKDLVRNIVHDQDLVLNTVIQYKTLILMCGFDKKKHKYMNPFDDVLYDNIPKNSSGKEDDYQYEAKPFIPTVPYNPDSYLCNVPLVNAADSDSLRMKTIEGDYFEDDMIVEFQYAKNDDTKKGPWKWVPLRVRQDKTQQLREGKKSMNEYETANGNWKSIHFPVTEEIITGAVAVPTGEVTDTIYYSLIERNSPHTKALRDFHNLYVKSKLIEGVADYIINRLHIKSPLLIDYAVGKAGDLSKWSRSKIGFVLGIDNHGDNITNSDDGACVRYLKGRKMDKDSKLRALFVEGSSALNIRTEATAFNSALEKELVQSVFGQGPNMNHKKYAFKHGIAQEGFHISSCQFALHYFFESTKTLHTFLQNLAECTRLNGYFIGTCFDGQKVFKILNKRDNGSLIKENESIRIDKQGKKVFEIMKKYSSSIQEFPADEASVGLPIYVYQESIDKMFIEYLVHFDYFTRLLGDYGFVLLENSELRAMGFTESTGLFNRLFGMMNKELLTSPDMFVRNGPNMSSDEKYISFLNRYFIFKKVREVSKISLKNMHKLEEDEKEKEEDEKEEKDEEEKNKKENKKETITKRKIRKVNKERVVLDEDTFSPILDVLVFDDVEMQTFYNGLNDKTKKSIAMLPVREQIPLVKSLWKRKQEKKKK